MDLERSGYLAKDPTGRASSGWKIVLNSKHQTTRQRFTLAHELGHFVLHLREGRPDEGSASMKNVVQLKRRFRSSDFEFDGVVEAREELEADSFASQLLMPENLVRFHYLKEKGSSSLAKLFRVSKRAMKRRMRELDIPDLNARWADNLQTRFDPYGMLGLGPSGLSAKVRSNKSRSAVFVCHSGCS